MEKFRLWKRKCKGKHGIELQEKKEDSNSVRSVNSITNSGKITVIVKNNNLTLVKVNPKSSPPKWKKKKKKKRGEHFQQILALWKLGLRIHSGENKIIPTFVGPVT